MSATKGAPEKFRGYVAEANANYVHVRATGTGGHEALINRANILHTRGNPCKIGGHGMVNLVEGKWTWTPDTVAVAP